MKEDADQTFTREAKAYLQPLTIADHLIQRAFEGRSMAGLDGQAALVFLAFAVEAFCNHVGSKLSEEYDDFDVLCAKDKLKETARLIDIPLDLGSRPFQTFHDLLQFRNEAAHGCTQTVVRHSKAHWPTPAHPLPPPKEPPTKWVTFCTPERVKRSQEDVKLGLKALYDASPLATECPFDREKWNVTLSREIKLTESSTTGCSPISNRADAV